MAKKKPATQTVYDLTKQRDRDYVSLEGPEPSALAKIINLHAWKAGEVLRWLALADLHIGCLREPMRLDNTLARHKVAFTEFLLVVDQYQPHIVAIAGDIFHFKNVYEQERQLWTWFMTELLKRTHVIVQPGNHDYYVRGKSTLDDLQEWHDSGIVPQLHMASNDPQYLTFTNGTDSINIYNAPCEIPLYLTGVRWADVVMYHGAVAGSKFDNGYDPTTDPEYVDKRIKLPYTEAAFWWLGDIHMRQSPAANAHYIGAIVQTKFSEDAEKGYMSGTFKFTKAGKFSKVDWNYHNLATPTQLITIVVGNEQELPATWPEECWIKLRHGSLVSLPPTLPTHIIKTELIGTERFVNEGGNLDTDNMVAVDDFHLEEDTEADVRKLLMEQSEIELSPAEVDEAVAEFFRLRREVG